MKLVLKEFQEEAVRGMYRAFEDAQRRANASRLEVVTLSAPTGAGKTVILTKLIELLFEGDEERAGDPNAIILWITDQPELNIQTRDKMCAASNVLTPSRILALDAYFDEETFPPGKVYFLNTQKLGTGTSWVRTGDGRTFTLWDTVRNTATANPGGFVVIIDEAHRGSRLDPKKADEANTIMQKFVLGSSEIPPIPLVIGISATLDRFTELLDAAATAKTARTHQRVDVSPTDVIESGLLKAKMVLYHPEDAKASDYPLLREAVRQWRDFESRWVSYCAAQEEHLVRPILLVQVEDGSKSRLSNTDLGAVVSAIRDEAGELGALAFAHAFQGGTAVALDDGTTVRHLAPSAIDGDPDVRVVLFKMSLNTGWDCPRAEVMMSFRPAKDATFIAQLVGRMVRTPLARTVEQDEVLNSIALMLPRFDEAEVGKVIRYLTDGNIGPTKVETNRERFVLERAPDLNDCLDALTGLPTCLVPRTFGVSEVQRVAQLADALSQSALKPEAASDARERLADVLSAEYLARRNLPAYRAVVKEHGTITVKPVTLAYDGGVHKAGDSREVLISPEMVTELYEWARRRLGLDLGLRYWQRRADKDKSGNHTVTKLELYALADDPEVTAALEKVAAKHFSSLMDEFKPRIRKLPESERARFEEVKRRAKRPVVDEMDFSRIATMDWSAHRDAVRWPAHLYQDVDGMLPERLNSWETLTLTEEMARLDFAGWLRNRERQPWALCIPYEVGGQWKGFYPDFIICRKTLHSVLVDIVDPHLVSLEDAPAKAAALAHYAEEHQDRFGRVDMVMVERPGTDDEQVKRLSLLDESTRRRVLRVSSTQHLRDLFDSAS